MLPVSDTNYNQIPHHPLEIIGWRVEHQTFTHQVTTSIKALKALSLC